MVTLLWQALLARVAGLTLRWPQMVVLGASVWLSYAADRWIEGWRLHRDDIRTQRHHFYQRRRWPVAVVWGMVFAVDVAVAFTGLSANELLAGSVLLVITLTYLLSHQLVHRHRRWRAPKEVLVAGLLTGGVWIFLGPWPVAGHLTTWMVLLALLYFTNCALISLWEREVDLAHGQTSLALDPVERGWAIRQVPLLLALLALAAGLGHQGPSPPGAGAAAATAAAACVFASAVLLAGVDRLEPRIGWQMARVLADVALMTPAVALLWM